jgi:hypothetical protein
MAESSRGHPGNALRRSREQKMEQWFGGRRWRLATETSLENEDVLIRDGEFWTKDGKVFRTPFGHKGHHGYILQEITQDGADIPGSRATFGWITLQHASEMFPGSVAEVPPRPYGKKSPLDPVVQSPPFSVPEKDAGIEQVLEGAG